MSSPVAEEAQRVGDDDERRAFVEDDGGSDADEPDEGGRDQEGDHAEAEEQVLADDPAGLAAETDDDRELGEVVAHERDVGGLEGDVGAGGTHGDADGGVGQGGGVVDAVADHGDLALLGAEPFDGGDLVLGHQVAPGIGEADLAGDRLGDELVVAREHDRPPDADRLQRCDRCLGPRRGACPSGRGRRGTHRRASRS